MAQQLAPGLLQEDAAAAGEEGKMTQDFSAAVSSLIQRIKDASKEGAAATGSPSVAAAGLFEEVFSMEKKCRQTNDSSSGARLCCFYLQLLADACFLCLPRRRREEEAGETGEQSAAAAAAAKVEAAAAAAAERAAAKAAAEASTESSEGLVLGTPEATRAAAAAATAATGARGSVTLSYLCEQLMAVCKKRGQLKRTIVEVVKQAMRWLPRLPQKQQKIELIEALKKVTAGKIFVEVDRARLILLLAEMKEAEGKIDEAAHLLQEVQVETYGAMETREKTEYILKQMELVLRKGDYIRCQIISKKINKKLLASDESLQDLKIQFYRHMVAYYMHEDLTLDCCKAFYSIFHTPSVQKNRKEWKLSLQCYILFMLLAPFDDEVKQLAEAVKRDEAKKLKEMPVFSELLKDMTKAELLDWPLPYEAELKKHPVFQEKPIHPGGEARWQLLRRRALQHNIRVMGTYYSRVHMDRVAALLRISRDEVEAEISELVCLNFLHAKMDRPAGTVEFGMKKSTFDRLNAWARDVSKVLEKVDLCSHLIQRERMVHAARARNAALMARHAS